MASLTSDPSDPISVLWSPTSCALKDPLDPASNVIGIPLVDFQRARRVTAARWEPIGRELEVVTRGSVRGYSGTLRIRPLDKAMFDAVWSLLARQATLLAQTVHTHYYVEVVGDIGEEDLKAEPVPPEPYPLRYARLLSVPVVQVAAP